MERLKLQVFLPCFILAPLVFTTALVKHTRVGSNWVNVINWHSEEYSGIWHTALPVNSLWRELSSPLMKYAFFASLDGINGVFIKKNEYPLCINSQPFFGKTKK